MRRYTIGLVGVITLSALLAAPFGLTGCGGEAPSVSSSWPEVDSERSVERPEEPVRWPLTGMPAPSADAVDIRVVSVKIENSEAARPQSNLDKADVVYETLTEGDITRLNALYHSQAPDVVGPVRSARLSDVYLVPQYDALFAHVGGNSIVLSRIRGAGIADMDQFANPGPYWRSSDRPRPHDMYMDVTELREAAVAKGMDAEAPLEPWPFEPSREATASITHVTVPFGGSNVVEWDYDAESDTYLRSQRGRPVSDAVSGERLGAKNVVVMWTRTTATSKRDATGAATLDIVLSGEGRVSVFRGGQRYDGTWTSRDAGPPVFTAADGSIIKPSPGNTWIEVIPTSANISMS